MHKLLKRQITKIFGSDFPASSQLTMFIAAVQSAYEDFESDRCLLERSLELSSKEMSDAILLATEAARIKSMFLANMSHEIRTPLNGVLGMLQLLEETALLTDQVEYVHTASASASSLLSIINDILDFSKMEAGKIDLEIIEFDFIEWFETTLQIMDIHAKQKEQELVGAIITKIPKRIKGDPVRLRQVLINLINNAIKFTDIKGGILVCVEHSELENSKLDLTFSVSDSGVGIASEKAQSIFEAFVQEDASITRKFGGTGLGLSISKGLVEQMGGKLWFESKHKIGTAFHCNAVLEKASEAIFETSFESSLTKQLADLRALVISSDEKSASHYSNALKNWGLDVSVITSLAALKQKHAINAQYDILIVNFHVDPSQSEDSQFENFKTEIALFQKELPLLVITPNHLNNFQQLLKDVKFKHLNRSDTFGTLLDSLLEVLGRKNKSAETADTDNINSTISTQKTILLAEDNLINQKVASKTLFSKGYKVIIVDNGLAALDALDNNEIDLVLMDLEMPIMGGIEAVQKIRKSSANYNSIPVIALTAHAMEATQLECRKAGMSGFLSKPFKLNELVSIIESKLTN